MQEFASFRGWIQVEFLLKLSLEMVILAQSQTHLALPKKGADQALLDGLIEVVDAGHLLQGTDGGGPILARLR